MRKPDFAESHATHGVSPFGAAKPDPRLFEAALELADCDPADAVHVGDSPDKDVAGAEAAGVRALLIDRNATSGGAITTLEQLPSVLFGA